MYEIEMGIEGKGFQKSVDVETLECARRFVVEHLTEPRTLPMIGMFCVEEDCVIVFNDFDSIDEVNEWFWDTIEAEKIAMEEDALLFEDEE